MNRRTFLKCGAALSLGVSVVARGGQQWVIIVSDETEVRRALSAEELPFDAIRPISREEADLPRRDLRRYLESERKRARGQHSRRLREILLNEHAYTWHCAGFTNKGSEYVFALFHLYSEPELRRPEFPMIADGGTALCRCVLSLKLSRIVYLRHNGNA